MTPEERLTKTGWEDTTPDAVDRYKVWKMPGFPRSYGTKTAICIQEYADDAHSRGYEKGYEDGGDDPNT